MKGLSGKSAVVTGGTSGIGYATVERLLSENVRVLFTGRNVEKGEAALKRLQDKYDTEAHFFAGDSALEQTCINIIKKALELFGEVDYLVNNAFAFTRKAWIAQRKDWLHVMEAGPINYATMITQFYLQRGKGTPGAIVNVSSISAYRAQPRSWTYNSAKGAVHLLTKCTAMDLAPHIRVNSCSPAGVFTDELTKGLGRSVEEMREQCKEFITTQHMLGRIIEPEECASAIVFLLSDEASAITATDLPVDMGWLAAGPSGIASPDMGDTVEGYVGTD